MTEENLIKQIEDLESDITKLEENKRLKNAEKATKLAQMQTRIFLERIFEPYMFGVCSVWGVSPEEGLRLLIEENASLDKIANNNPKDLAELMNQPEIQVIVNIAGPLRNVSDEWIQQKMEMLFDVMRDIRPELATIIAETPGGTEWFQNSLTGLRNILFSVPKLDPLTGHN